MPTTTLLFLKRRNLKHGCKEVAVVRQGHKLPFCPLVLTRHKTNWKELRTRTEANCIHLRIKMCYFSNGLIISLNIADFFNKNISLIQYKDFI